MVRAFVGCYKSQPGVDFILFHCKVCPGSIEHKCMREKKERRDRRDRRKKETSKRAKNRCSTQQFIPAGSKIGLAAVGQTRALTVCRAMEGMRSGEDKVGESARTTVVRLSRWGVSAGGECVCSAISQRLGCRSAMDEGRGVLV